MSQNKKKLRIILIFRKRFLFTNYFIFCKYYTIIAMFKVFQPIFLKLGMYVKVKETLETKIKLGPIQTLK